MVDCESLRKLARIKTRRPKNLPRVFVLVGIVGPGWFLEFDEEKRSDDTSRGIGVSDFRNY